jgi:hypothetical protein
MTSICDAKVINVEIVDADEDQLAVAVGAAMNRTTTVTWS